MATVKAFITSHPVAIYFALTFVISWGGLLAVGGPEGLSSTDWQSDPRLPFLIVAMLAGPSGAGVTLTALAAGRVGLRELFSGLLRSRVGIRWYAVALLTAPIVMMAAHLAFSLASPLFVPPVLATSDQASRLVSAIAGALAVGFFEELGWTGFATPRLRLRHGLLATGLLVGVPWGAWHFLTNNIWIARAFSGDMPVGLFLVLNGLSLLVGLSGYRVLIVWVYERTGSLLVAMLMHASLSACLLIFSPSATGTAFLTYAFVVSAIWWVVVAIVAAASRQVPRGHTLRSAPSC